MIITWTPVDKSEEKEKNFIQCSSQPMNEAEPVGDGCSTEANETSSIGFIW